MCIVLSLGDLTTLTTSLVMLVAVLVGERTIEVHIVMATKSVGKRWFAIHLWICPVVRMDAIWNLLLINILITVIITDAICKWFVIVPSIIAVEIETMLRLFMTSHGRIVNSVRKRMIAVVLLRSDGATGWGSHWRQRVLVTLGASR
jgi:hypothetical protein